jgi:formiminotetrahydrofolate cyclodeaminase
MTDEVRRLTVDEVLEAIATPRPSSGAGIAGALALAMSAACARKAVGVTAKRRDDVQLQAADAHLALLQHRAVAQAQRDQLLFQSYLRSKELAAAEHLVDSSQLFRQLVADVAKELDRLPPLIAGHVAGDLDAATALHHAAAAVAQRLFSEAEAEISRSLGDVGAK